MIQSLKVKWGNLASEQEASGQSIAGFCRARGLPSFGSALGSTIEVRLSNGRSLMVGPEFDASHLRALLAVVESES